MADEMLGEVTLTLSSSQLAELRAIDHEYWWRVHELVSAGGAAAADRDRPLTPAETAELDAMLVSRLTAMLTPEQRAAIRRR